MPCCPTDVFTLEGEEDMVRFAKLAAPTREELSHILERVAARTLAMVRHRGLLEEEYLDGLASVQAEAIQMPLSLGAPPEEDPRKLAAFIEGFSLQAGTHVHQRDREGLEHLLRYALRPPLSLERLSRAADGRVVLSLRRPLFDGTAAVAFTPTQMLKRLAALVPTPPSHCPSFGTSCSCPWSTLLVCYRCRFDFSIASRVLVSLSSSNHQGCPVPPRSIGRRCPRLTQSFTTCGVTSRRDATP
jgi:hypothetical protein